MVLHRTDPPKPAVHLCLWFKLHALLHGIQAIAGSNLCNRVLTTWSQEDPVLNLQREYCKQKVRKMC